MGTEAVKMLPSTKAKVCLVFILWSLNWVSADEYECGCQNWTCDCSYIVDSVKLNQSRKIQCCVGGIPEEGNASITWTFQDKPLDKELFSDTTSKQRCKGKVLLLKRASKKHEGNYTCTITNRNGVKGSLTTSLKVYESEKFLQMPEMAFITENTSYAYEGDTVKFTCGAVVGTPTEGFFPPTVSWLHIPPQGQAGFLPAGVEVHSAIKESVIIGSMEIKKITKEHFGTYICEVSNTYGIVMKNATLIHGMSPEEKMIYCWKLGLIVALVIIGMALWLVYCSWRCRWTLEIWIKEKKPKTVPDPGYWYDVFIVHGEMASNWVKDVLLPTLELTYGYTCFVPDRDMLGGEQYADSISKAMSKCRRILLVITPCLLQSQWTKWALHNGINTCLTSQTRILAVVLQEMGNNVVTSDTAGLLKTLQLIKKIGVPRSCGLQRVGEKPHHTGGGMMNVCSKNDKDQKADLKLSVPEFKIENDVSHSPKNQRLSNMITGSNHASCEKLDEEEDLQCHGQKNIKDQGIIYTVCNDFEDPGTPCSITPFILPSSKKSDSIDEDPETCDAALNCMNNACCGDPEIIFWQKVRVRLDLPAVRQRHVTAETIA